MIELAISGCLGRMGQAITRLTQQDRAFNIRSLLEHKDHPKIGGKLGNLQITQNVDSLKGCDCLIEFTTPEATMEHMKTCVKYGVKMVVGTTGLQPDQIDVIKKMAVKIPIVFASNMSVGVNILFKLSQLAAEKTSPYDYKITLSETHHVHKKDAPSGTAKTLAEIAEKASGRKVEDIKSIREGEVVGDHTLVFESHEDTITLFHHAKSRDIFAKGALVAAKFLADKKKGLFTMQDVLGLK